MKEYDDVELIKAFGLSRELTEHSDVSSTIYNDYYNGSYWSIRVQPPIERNDLLYFIIYKDIYYPTSGLWPFTAKKIARISMTNPEYIHCNDCSIEEWILSKNEKKYLCKLLQKNNYWIWNTIQSEFMFQLKGWDGRNSKELNLPIPNYMQLPEL